jgi:cysteine desulfurase
VKLYLDHAASTPADPEVVTAMLPFFSESAANAASLHQAGLRAAMAVEAARSKVAGALGAGPDEILFTSCGTESANLAIKGLFFARGQVSGQIVVSAIEHPAVLESARWLARRGADLTILPVDGQGFVHPDELRAALGPDTLLVSVQLGNHEIGTVQDLEALAGVVASFRRSEHSGPFLHVDACQGMGEIPVDVRSCAVDLLSIDGQKLGGPQGVGALFVRKGVVLESLLHGGGQESGRRAGSSNVAGIVGLGCAVGLVAPRRTARVAELRDAMLSALEERFSDLVLHGPRTRRLAGNLNFRVGTRSGKALFQALDRLGVFVSTGSACHSGQNEPSPVLRAIGLSDQEALGAVRVTLGTSTTQAQVDLAVEALARTLSTL